MRFTPAPEISGIDLSGIGLGVDDDGKILECVFFILSEHHTC